MSSWVRAFPRLVVENPSLRHSSRSGRWVTTLRLASTLRMIVVHDHRAGQLAINRHYAHRAPQGVLSEVALISSQFSDGPSEFLLKQQNLPL